MQIQAAELALGSIHCAIVLVGMDLIKTPGEADMAIDRLGTTFPDQTVILMAQNAQGSPAYYGDQNIVEALRGVALEDMPWREYKTR